MEGGGKTVYGGRGRKVRKWKNVCIRFFLILSAHLIQMNESLLGFKVSSSCVLSDIDAQVLSQENRFLSLKTNIIKMY